MLTWRSAPVWSGKAAHRRREAWRFQPSQPRSTRTESQSWWEPGCARNAVSRWRPTSPDICCADATVQWRCQSCGKVSEGFAFPYGMCPHCGGSLRVLERAGVSDEASLNAIRTASRSNWAARPSMNAPPTNWPILCSRGCSPSSPPWSTSTWKRCRGATTCSRPIQPRDPRRHRGDPGRRRGRYRRSGDLVPHGHHVRETRRRFLQQARQRRAGGLGGAGLSKELAAEEVEHVALLETDSSVGPRAGPGCSRASRERR